MGCLLEMSCLLCWPSSVFLYFTQTYLYSNQLLKWKLTINHTYSNDSTTWGKHILKLCFLNFFSMKKAVSLINEIDIGRFPRLLTRILQKLHLKVCMFVILSLIICSYDSTANPGFHLNNFLQGIVLQQYWGTLSLQKIWWISYGQKFGKFCFHSKYVCFFF